ncbi:MAG: GNAT family N-acetyltransferase [Chloroflexi bacterium]|nr:GNAT family N-acetyltransferase [Chloroflexota bacterium]
MNQLVCLLPACPESLGTNAVPQIAAVRVRHVARVIDDGDAREAIDDNLLTHVTWIHSHLPLARAFVTPEIAIADSGFATDTFNIVMRARMSKRRAGVAIPATVARMAGYGRPYCWWHGPLDTPADLPARLEGAGLARAGESLAMVADLDDLPSVVIPPALTIRRATTVAEVLDFARVVAANWSPPDDAVVAFYTAGAPFILRPDSPIDLYVGRVDGEPVAAAELCLVDSVAGLYSVCTREAHRRRGYGTALTLHALHDAREDGAEVGALQAADQGQRIYARAGFRTVGVYREYKPGG